MATSKIALITGGSRGLGRDMALSLAQNGKDVVFTYHSNRNAADEVVAEIEKKRAEGVCLSAGHP